MGQDQSAGRVPTPDSQQHLPAPNNQQQPVNTRNSARTPSGDRAIFCHICNSYVPLLTESGNCNVCNQGFVEYVSNAASTSNAQPQPNRQRFSLGFGTGLPGIYPTAINGMPLHHQAGSAEQQTFDQTLNNMINRVMQGMMGGVQQAQANAQQQQQAGNQNQQPAQTITIPGFSFSIVNGDIRPINAPAFQSADGQPLRFEDIMTQLLDSFEMNDHPVPTNVIDRIPTISVTQKMLDAGGNKAQCSICFEDFHIDENVWELPICEHIFHSNCVTQWFNSHSTCPICRTDISTAPIVNNQSAPDSNGSTSTPNAGNAEHNISAEPELD